MKKLPALLNTPARAVMAVGLIVLLSEYLIMALFDVIHGALPTRDNYQLVMIFNYLDPILLIAIVSPVLYILIFRPMRNQQDELARQVDELHRFQKMAVGRELRMKELVEKIDTLRIPLSAETQLTASSPEKPRDEAAQPASTSEMEAEQRSALLFMLEDLENSRRKVEQAHQEWMAALDVVNDPIFLHDKDFRILRCNKAYQQCAGIPFHEIIGKPYYEVFPENHAPLPCCLRAMEKAEEEEEEEELEVGETIFRSRAFSIRDEQGAYLYSVHTLEDITVIRRADAALYESEEKFRKMSESAQDAIIMMADKRISFWNAAAERIFGYTAAEALGQELHALIVPKPAHARFTQAFPHFQASGEGPIIGKVIEVTALRKGGEEFPVDLSISATQFGGQWHAIGIVRDITARRRAEEELRLKAQLLDGTNDSVFVSDFDGNFTYLNEAAWKTRGYTRDELMGMNLHVLDVPEHEKLIQARVRELMEKGHGIFESAHRRKDGSVMPIEVSARIIESGGRKLILAAARDITERKQAEEKLRETRDYLENLFNHANAPIIAWDPSYRITMFNHAFEHMSGRDASEVIGKQIDTLFPADRKDEAMTHIYQTRRGERWESVEIPILNSSGKVRTALWNSATLYSADGKNVVATMAQGQDITERKRAEDTLRESEERFYHLFENMSSGVAIYQPDAACEAFIFKSVNRAAERIDQIQRKDVAGRNVEEVFPGVRAFGLLEVFKRVCRSGSPESFPAAIYQDERITGWRDNYVYRLKSGEIVTVYDDVTERKQAEIALNHANRALAALSAVNRNLVHATNEAELFQTTCDAIIQQRGYRLAWVGYVLHDESKSIKIVSRAGHDEGYLDGMQLTWAETERGTGPSGRAIRSGATQLCQDMINDPYYLPWRDAASQHGYASDIALPLIGENGSVFGILHVYSGEVNAFIPSEIALLEEMAGDMAFGVRSLHTRHERDLALVRNREQLLQLQDSLEDTVRAMANIVEMRDPYTAGHQVRVADLAVAIAKQMALPEEQIHAIHLAGVVHDLGKIKVPAEILSKPGRISDLEFGLIKIHPQAGYDILKGIDFPWPIAQMVLQHHERLDGSGYPQGLKDDAILLEARILSVADVIEAMSSHRPYRPGLGIEVALAEITKQRGVHYDPQVVDACLALFREEHYSFKS